MNILEIKLKRVIFRYNTSMLYTFDEWWTKLEKMFFTHFYWCLLSDFQNSRYKQTQSQATYDSIYKIHNSESTTSPILQQ